MNQVSEKEEKSLKTQPINGDADGKADGDDTGTTESVAAGKKKKKKKKKPSGSNSEAGVKV